jgi:hypothetical protein
LQGNFKARSVAKDIKKFMMENSEMRNDNPIPDGITLAVPKESIKVPYNLALNEYVLYLIVPPLFISH